MTPEDLDTTLSLLVDNEISPDQFEELQDLLTKSEAALCQYLEHIKLHSVLTIALSPHTSKPGTSNVVPIDRIVARKSRKSLRAAFIIGIAAAVVFALISLFVIVPEPPARFTASSLAQYSLTHALSGGRKAPGDNEMAIGSRLELSRGSIELQLKSGVRGVVTGPADLTLRGESLVGLAYGKVVFEVPENAVGFQVDTPEFLLTDLGTEFGIVSTIAEPDEVHVFHGRVKVVNHRGTNREIELATGNARIAEASGGWKKTESKPEDFFHVLPSRSTPPPFLHWSFDEAIDNRFPVAGTHPDRLRMATKPVSGAPKTGKGKIGQALRFEEIGDKLYTNWPGISGDSPRTVAFWLRLPPVPDEKKNERYDYTIVNWGTVSGQNSEWAVRVTNQLFIPGSRATLGKTYHLNLYLGGGWFNGSTELADGNWHHIAIRFNGDRSRGRPVVTMFVDGRPEPTRYLSPYPPAPINTDTSSSQALPFRIASSRTGRDTIFPGEIDELYVFDGKVDDDVIRELATAP